jgi:hypothetical protein
MGARPGRSPSLVAVVDFGSAERHDDLKLPRRTAMRKKVFGLVIVVAAVVGSIAVLTATPAEAKSCPRGSHLVKCPHQSFCCPNSVMCDCLP